MPHQIKSFGPKKLLMACIENDTKWLYQLQQIKYELSSSDEPSEVMPGLLPFRTRSKHCVEFGAGLLIGDHDVDQLNILVTLDYIETCYLGI